MTVHGGPDPRLGVVAGARPRGLPALAGLVLAAFALVEGGLLLLGLLVTRVLSHTVVHREEGAFEREVLAHRTPLLDTLTRSGTVLGATRTVVALTAVGCVLLAVRGHGPRLPAFLVLAVAGETVLFVLASLVLHRVRPPIPHLDPAPPTSSFPSGHTAATVALWGGLALGLARTRPGHRCGCWRAGRRRAAGARPVLPALPGHALAHGRRRQRPVHAGLAAGAAGRAAAARRPARGHPGPLTPEPTGRARTTGTSRTTAASWEAATTATSTGSDQP